MEEWIDCYGDSGLIPCGRLHYQSTQYAYNTYTHTVVIVIVISAITIIIIRVLGFVVQFLV